jgi:hypothetical protein
MRRSRKKATAAIVVFASLATPNTGRADGPAGRSDTLDNCRELAGRACDYDCDIRGRVTKIDPTTATFMFEPIPGQATAEPGPSRLKYPSRCAGPSFPPPALANVDAQQGPGRVLLRIEAVGGTQQLKLVWGEPSASGDGGVIHTTQCKTPCEAFVTPGKVHLTIDLEEERWLAVGESGARLVYERAPTAYVWGAGAVIAAVGGGGILAGGYVLLKEAGSAPDHNHASVVDGQRVLGVGLGVLALAVLVMGLAPKPRDGTFTFVNLGGAPVSGGFVGGLGGRF